MSHLLNKLLGREDESQSQSSSTKTETHTSASSGGEQSRNVQRQNSSGGQTGESHTVQREGVSIKSTVSSDINSTVSMANQQKLNELVTKLGSTHNQIDEYAKKQTAKINDDIQREIDQVVGRTRTRQEELLKRANEHTTQIDADYRARLQKMVEEIDAAKAKRIAEIESELNSQQAEILQAARAEIDQLNQKAAGLKIGVLQEAQAKAASQAEQVTAQAATLGQASTVHNAKGTTTIKTEVTGTATTKEIGSTQATAGGCADGSCSKSSSTTTAMRKEQSCADGSCSTATHKEHSSAGGAKTGSEMHTSETTRHQSNASKH